MNDNSEGICPYYREDAYEVQGIMYKMSAIKDVCELKEQDLTMFNNCEQEKGIDYKNCRTYNSFIKELNNADIKNSGR